MWHCYGLIILAAVFIFWTQVLKVTIGNHCTTLFTYQFLLKSISVKALRIHILMCDNVTFSSYFTAFMWTKIVISAITLICASIMTEHRRKNYSFQFYIHFLSHNSTPCVRFIHLLNTVMKPSTATTAKIALGLCFLFGGWKAIKSVIFLVMSK